MSEFNFSGNDRVPTEISKLRQFSLKARPDTLNLGLGKPFLDTPPELKKLAKELLDKSPLDYSENAGTIALREAVASRFNLPIGSVCITHGAQEALMCTMMGLLNPGDEVLISDPGFVAYKTMIEMLGAKVLTYNLDYKQDQFVYNLETILNSVSSKTKIVILGRVSNPTASDLTPVELSRLASELKKKNVLLICDEVYGELHFQEFYQPGTVLGDNVISINSLSKSHALTGWRIGYVLCRMENLMKKIIVAHQYIGTCATRISQNLAEKIFTNSELYISIVQMFKHHYNESFNLFLSGSGMKIPKPCGSFYLFPRIPEKFKTDYDFAEDLLNKHNILVIPGSVFGKLGEKHVRLALSLDHNKIKKVADIFKLYY